MKRLVLVLVVLALIVSACSGSDGGEDAAVEEGRQVAGQDVSAAQDSGGGEAAADEAAQEAEDAGASQEGGVGEGGSALPAAVRPSDRIIKEGTMRIEVADGEFDTAFQRVVDIAQRLGGDVAASETAVSDDGHTAGSLTVRVPVQSYEQLLVGMGEIGEVTHRRVTSQDVSAEFVDLEARQRQLRAQEAFYLDLLEDTTSVNEAVTVREELDRIQADIERITGRLNLLENRTSFSTLTVELFEPGAAVPQGDPTPARGLARYWETGLDALVAAVGTMLVVGLGALPLAVLVLIVLLVIRAIRRRPGSAPPAPSTPSA